MWFHARFWHLHKMFTFMHRSFFSEKEQSWNVKPQQKYMLESSHFFFHMGILHEHSFQCVTITKYFKTRSNAADWMFKPSTWKFKYYAQKCTVVISFLYILLIFALKCWNFHGQLCIWDDFIMFSHRAEEITILITYLIKWTSCITMKNATRLEVGICVTALETPIQTQFCFTPTVSLCYPCFWAHDTSCPWLILLFCGRNFLWEMTFSQSL